MDAYPSLNVGYPRVKGAKDNPFGSISEAMSTPEYRGREHRMLQVVGRTRSDTSPCKVGGRSLVAFRTSAIFENDRVQAEVLAQC